MRVNDEAKRQVRLSVIVTAVIVSFIAGAVLMSGHSSHTQPTETLLNASASSKSSDASADDSTPADTTDTPPADAPAASTPSAPVSNAPSTPAPATETPPTGCTNGTYTNSDGNTVCSPEAVPTAPAGATAQCNDGTYSFSQHHSGTCSGHGGVAAWL